MRNICIIFMLLFCFCTTTATSNQNVKFDVKIPSKISLKKTLPCEISFTNLSKKPMLVPKYLLSGLGIFYYYEIYDESGQVVMPDIIYEYRSNPDAFGNKPTLLPPGRTRSNADFLETEYLFPKPGRYRMVFYWDGFLDGDTKGERSRFASEKWVEVTE